jgi:hypothetical protein
VTHDRCSWSRSAGDILLAAAWLHDTGYADALRDTGFHPIDDAHHLQTVECPSRIVGLVAHPSAARCVARARGLTEQVACFTQGTSPVSDALIYADQTVGPHEGVMTVDQCPADMLRWHGPDSLNAAVHAELEPLLHLAGHRVHQRLSARKQPPSAA